LASRLGGPKESVSAASLAEHAPQRLEAFQSALFERALELRRKSTYPVETWQEFREKLEVPGGFLMAHWDGTRETEDRIQEETKATIRCIPLDQVEEAGICVRTGQPSKGRVIFAKAY
jgi:prolyl-tRNA synthetase